MVLMVASIDFGTTISGWAYLLQNDFEHNPAKAYAKNWSDGDLISLKSKIMKTTALKALIFPKMVLETSRGKIICCY